MGSGDVPVQYSELLELARARGLEYPIETKERFVTQMTQSGEAVIFRGIPYDPEFGASLIPEFFFPITSEDDLVHKAMELIMSRGLVPFEQLDC